MSDIILKNTLKKTQQIDEIVSIINSISYSAEDIEILKSFFIKLQNKTNDLWSVLLEISKEYDIDATIMVSMLKKTKLIENVKSERKQQESTLIKYFGK